MYTKYFTIEIPNTEAIKAERKRREILHKRIRTACGVAGVLAFFYMFGLVGGLEQDMMTIKEFIIRGAVTLAVMAASIGISNRI